MTKIVMGKNLIDAIKLRTSMVHILEVDFIKFPLFVTHICMWTFMILVNMYYEVVLLLVIIWDGYWEGSRNILGTCERRYV